MLGNVSNDVSDVNAFFSLLSTKLTAQHSCYHSDNALITPLRISSTLEQIRKESHRFF